MKKFVISAIRFYQREISPLSPPRCRYIPTCSQYALEAVEKYGAIKGTFLATKRILRCNPFHKGGYDPVP
ncbi:MAG: membrane protein insertion efficiency factor YidD [Clostridiales bacterium]|nr:membrane protein insertion efficiency factor YidD [Clostridiales bacterium]